MCFDSLYAYESRRRNLITIPVRKAYGSLIAQNRNDLVRDAIANQAKWILFLDTDMVFPENVIELLQRHDLDIVSGVYHGKQPPFVPIMAKKEKDGYWYVSITKYPSSGLLEVDAFGGGCFLAKTELFKRIPEPWFSSPAVLEMVAMNEVRKLEDWEGDPSPLIKNIKKILKDLRGNPSIIGEDYYFCNKLQQAKVKMYVDTSLELGHVGKYVYSIEEFRAMADQGVFDKANEHYGFTDGTEEKK